MQSPKSKFVTSSSKNDLQTLAETSNTSSWDVVNLIKPEDVVNLIKPETCLKEKTFPSSFLSGI